MENREQENKVKSSSADPKPTDEVQLTIETVTPDTHKSVPKTPIDSDKIEERVKTANDNEQISNVTDNATGQDTKSEDKATDTSENREEIQHDDDGKEENQQKETNDGEGDERDKIETIAP